MEELKEINRKLISRLEFHESRWRKDVERYEAQIAQLKYDNERRETRTKKISEDKCIVNSKTNCVVDLN